MLENLEMPDGVEVLGDYPIVGEVEIEISGSSDYETYTYHIDEIVLGYGYVGKGDTRALVPVWYFFFEEKNTGICRYDSKCVYKRINALDGSYVDENMKYIEYVNTDMQE